MSVQTALIIIDNLPHSVTISEGKPLNLSAKIDGKPLPEVTWIKDGIRARPDGTYMLTIGSTQSSDSEEYVMIARNPAEEVVAVTNVEVEQGPVLIEKLPERVNVLVGKPLKLTAKIQSDSPPDKIMWTKDGVPIKPSDNVKLKSRPDGTLCLEIDSAQPSYVGKYAVYAKIGAKGVGSMGIVTVEEAPAEQAVIEEEVPGEEGVANFTDKFPKTVNITEGNPLKLVEKIARRGDRIPEFNWTRNGKTIEDKERVRREWSPNGTVFLNIDNSLLSDAGTYNLSFKTSEGVKSTVVNVQITPKSTLDKPVFIKGLTRISTEEGKSCRLDCKVSGDVDAMFWLKK